MLREGGNGKAVGMETGQEYLIIFFFSSRRRHTRFDCDWSSDVCSSDLLSADFFGDRLKLIKEILPTAAQVTALSNPNNPGHGGSLKDAELGARSSGLSFQSVAAKSANELGSAIGSAAKGGANALFILTDALFNSHLTQIAQATIKNRLPAVYDRTDFVEAGGLVSYGVNLPDLSRRAAEYIDQIFKGKKPGDLTLVQPIKLDLSINLKTAKQIGVTIPPNVLARADKVIR